MLTVFVVLLVSLALVVTLPVLALLALVVLDMASMDVMKLVCRYSFGAHLSARFRPSPLATPGGGKSGLRVCTRYGTM